GQGLFLKHRPSLDFLAVRLAVECLLGGATRFLRLGRQSFRWPMGSSDRLTIAAAKSRLGAGVVLGMLLGIVVSCAALVAAWQIGWLDPNVNKNKPASSLPASGPLPSRPADGAKVHVFRGH